MLVGGQMKVVSDRLNCLDISFIWVVVRGGVVVVSTTARGLPW